ncbi:hypothetical protein GHT06_016277 [Daphnia sinensis]|uniref:Secreted protein n=1 Tax=Daphnia sinensis TaxID=1820382 RepID=A0AAD5LF19_9CRUS|nr:hypothetical protein GHT06_016277 [Daphnia sinensis]
MASVFVILLGFIVSSAYCQNMDGQAGQGAVVRLESLLGPANTFRLETYVTEGRRDPSEFLAMCSLFRQYIYIPPGPKPTFRFVYH